MKNLVLLFLTLIPSFVFGQREKKSANSGSPVAPLLEQLRWRSVGPYRGGRSLAVAGHASQPYTFYFGAAGGGVWKTTDGGQSWGCISDSTFHSSSVGCIAVAPNDPNVLYVGMGETEMRGNITYGDGMYRSADGGKSWKHIGLKESYAIGRVVVHPRDANTVYVAAMGQIFGKNKERGIYRTRDGGQTWQQILMHSDSVGGIEVALDPSNPDIVLASLWNARRGPHYMSDGGEGSGLYRSADGGDTWKLISTNAGMPKGMLGKIEVAISPANSQRIWAMVENAANGGLYRSDDGGTSWNLLNTDKNLRQRPWYFSEITPDAKDENVLYIMNVNFWRTADGGQTFRNINVGHGDCHDLWVSPANPDCMILGDDGGAEVTYNGGATWSDLDIPTAQFYHVALDNDFPYSIYGAQQDNSTIKIKSRTSGFSIGESDWYPVAGGESGYIAPDPENPDVTYGGSYMGYLSRHDHITGQDQNVSVYPVGTLGAGAEDMKYRFQWTYPILFSPHDPNTLYATSQFVHKSTNEGMSWEIISPTLTRNDPATLVSSGGPITKDNTGAETYSTVFTFAESPVQKGVMWAGSDDGYVHVSRDGGKNWERCTPPSLPEWALISIIEPSYRNAGTAYVAANRYKLADNKPYLFKTTDFGKTWSLITTGIPDGAYCRVVRNDPNYPDILYAGTEIGIFVSLDAGATWLPLQANLPLTPIHDIAVQARDRDLVVATHGRSFWVLDNLEPIYEIHREKLNGTRPYLIQPEKTWRTPGGSYFSPDMQVGENAPNGVVFNYLLPDTTSKEVKLGIFEADRDTIAVFSSQKNKAGEPLKINNDFFQPEKITRPGYLTASKGLNTFTWDTRYADAKDVTGGSLMWSGSVVGPIATPGSYVAELSIGDSVIATQSFDIQLDPRIKVSAADLEASLKFQLQVRDKLTEVNEAINKIRKIRKQINDVTAAIQDTAYRSTIETLAKPILDSIANIEKALIQTDAKAFQDLLALPVRLNDKLAGLGSTAATADTRPTAQTIEAYTDITAQIDSYLAKLKAIIDDQIAALNQKLEQKRPPAIKAD